MVSWYFAQAAGVATPRDRRIVAWAGFMPDIDVLAYLGAIVYYRFDKELAFENVWKEVHHRYTHNLAFVLLTGIVAYWIASAGAASRIPGAQTHACAGSSGASSSLARSRSWRRSASIPSARLAT
jgi:hypothetical protein